MNQKLLIYISVFLGSTLLVGAFFWNGKPENNTPDNGATISQEDGTQVIHILARGGYSPRIVNAKADVPTKLEVETKGTYDCSSSLNIPALGIQEFLSRTGTKTLLIPAQKKGTEIVGTCSMGMYSFRMRFN